MLINFVSNIKRDEFSGGFSAVNHAIYEAVQQIAEVHYVGPIYPPVSQVARFTSKALRILQLPGRFPFFSNSRLESIASQVKNGIASGADLDLYTGVTPWVMCPRDRPRIAWTDCSFNDYITVYHSRSCFQQRDINRILVAERGFANSCQTIMMTSRWALNRAASHWDCLPGRLCNIGIFGNESVPDSQYPSSSTSYLLFSSTNFQAKGGQLVLEVFAYLRRERPQLRLVIIGDAPRYLPASDSGIVCMGYLSKSNPLEREKYREALANAFCLLLPTTSDMAPLTLLEAAAFGTPTVSFESFAIPELIVNNITGILLSPSSPVETLARAINDLMNDKSRYEAMRRNTQFHFSEHFSRRAFQQKALKVILDHCSGDH